MRWLIEKPLRKMGCRLYGIRKVIIESDSKSAVETLVHKEKIEEHPEALVRSIGEFIKRDWQIKIKHTYRKGNRAADWLAKKSLDIYLEFVFINQPPGELRRILGEDIRGTMLPRLVSGC
ncbi:hypothetical protein AAHE18_01G182200 [Arachis hypogaea]